MSEDRMRCPKCGSGVECILCSWVAPAAPVPDGARVAEMRDVLRAALAYIELEYNGCPEWAIQPNGAFNLKEIAIRARLALLAQPAAQQDALRAAVAEYRAAIRAVADSLCDTPNDATPFNRLDAARDALLRAALADTEDK